MKKNLFPLLFLFPALALYAVFFVAPVFFSGALSFMKWNLFGPAAFVGAENYRALFGDSVFWQALKNTFAYALGTVPLSMGISIVLAAVVEKSGKRSRGIFRTLLFLPVIASLAITALVWSILLSPHFGHVNIFLKMLGIAGPNWLNDPSWAMLSLVIVGVWRGASYNMVLYIAGLKNIDPQLYEAARIDGAGGINQFFHVSVPLLSHVSLFVLVVSLIQSFQVFATVNIMTEGGPNNATNVLVYHVYQEAFRFFDIGRSSAAAIVMFVVVLSIALVQIRMMDRAEKPSRS